MSEEEDDNDELKQEQELEGYIGGWLIPPFIALNSGNAIQHEFIAHMSVWIYG
jgi:hypothetical protein